MSPGEDPAQVPTAPDAAAPAPELDYWEQRGHTIIRHIRQPRTILFRPNYDVLNIPVPVDQIDVTRDFETTSTGYAWYECGLAGNCARRGRYDPGEGATTTGCWFRYYNGDG